ncbi:hypothetical protein [Burkholderia sp. SIMBA_062]|uniref:hypothetical protein n=1 Tax=Burkholderia sp. SIMBA_062 TaxID=3085803 RepID=UPI00397DC0D2
MSRIEIIRQWRSCSLAMRVAALSFAASSRALFPDKVADGYGGVPLFKIVTKS